MPDMRQYRYRQTLLFMAVLIIPSVAVALLGWRDFTHEQAKQVRDSEQMARDSAQRAKEDFRQKLFQTLERIKLQLLGGASPDRAVLLLAPVKHGRVELPWEINPAADRFRQSVEEPEFDSKILKALAAEFAEKKRVKEKGGVFDYEPMVAAYREAAQTARDENQRIKARLALAAVLQRAGRRTEAVRLSRELLELPTEIVDDKRIPIAYHAADQLVQTAKAPHASPEIKHDVISRAERDLASPESVPPGGIYVLQPLLEQLAGSRDQAADDSRRLLEQIESRIRFLERAAALQKDYATLRLTASDWRIYDPSNSTTDAWLVSLTPSGSETNARVVAVNAKDIVSSLQSQEYPQHAASMFTISSSEGELLGTNFPDVHVAREHPIQPAAERAVSPHPVYLLSLFSVLLLTFVGGFLVWRDTRREIRLAELRTQFVSSVSHELKTPLTAIRMFAEIMQIQGPVDLKRHNQHLDTIVSESERLTRLLNNVLDFSRIERGQKQYNLQPARLSDIVDAAVRTMRYPLKQRGFEFHLDVDNGIPPVKVDRDAMEQAILNLLSNAMKYSGQSRDIALRLFADNDSALIQVTDSGIGIPPEQHKRIFERFYRAPSIENQSISGTGLGLALVTHIMEAHGGKVELKSAAGEGSTFSLRIPIYNSIAIRDEVQS